MVRDVTLGQFMPGNSIIHSLDARSKILLLIAYIVFIFIAKNYLSLLIITAASLLVIFSTKIKFKFYLKSMKVILFVVLFTGILNIFYGSGEVLWQLGFVKITEGGINNAIFVTIRIATLVPHRFSYQGSRDRDDDDDRAEIYSRSSGGNGQNNECTKSPRCGYGKRKRFSADKSADSCIDSSFCIVIQTGKRPCHCDGMSLLSRRQRQNKNESSSVFHS